MRAGYQPSKDSERDINQQGTSEAFFHTLLKHVIWTLYPVGLHTDTVHITNPEKFRLPLLHTFLLSSSVSLKAKLLNSNVKVYFKNLSTDF